MNLSRTLAAGLLAAFTIGTPVPAPAADLYGEDYRSRDGAEYDDPGYSGESRDYSGQYNDGQDNRDYNYRDEDEQNYRYRGSSKDGQYLTPMNRPPRYAQDSWQGRNGCTPRWQIRDRIQSDGWRDIRRLRVAENFVILRAVRPSGRAFDLKVDRCSGEIVDRRPAYMGQFGRYAPQNRRYSRTY